MSVNKVIILGHLGKDPDVRYLEGGTCVAKFPIATSESYKNKNGEKITNTDWHNIVAWRGLAEVVEKYVKKGMQVYIEGKIKTSSYDKDGITRYRTDIVADTVQMLGSKSGGQGSSQDTSSQQKVDKIQESKDIVEKAETENDNVDNGEMDDLPF